MEEKTALVTLDVGRPTRRTAKLTPKKRKQFLEHLAKTGNVSASAALVGVDRQSIFNLKDRDPKFKAAYEYVENHITDTIEEISLRLSLQPTREGFNDRKLQLMARRPEKYNPQPQTIVNTQVNVDIPVVDLRSALAEIEVAKVEDDHKR
jgi:hypothetical protein